MTTKKTTTKKQSPKQQMKSIRIPSGDIDKDFEAITLLTTLLLKDEGYLDPTLFVIFKDKGMASISGKDFPSDPDEKVELFTRIGKRYADRDGDVEAFVFAHEAWGSQQAKESEEGTANFIMPSQDPNRVEILMISGKRVSDGNERYAVRQFSRDEDKMVATITKAPKTFGEMEKGTFDKQGDVKSNNRLMDALWKSYRFHKFTKSL